MEKTAILSFEETLDSKKQQKAGTVSLAYLFLTFLKIGFVSFGGHMALVSVIQRILVDRDKVLEDEVILNSIGVASFLPGPLAVNVVGQVGFHLRRTSGAIVSTVAVILPAFLIIVGVAWQYFARQQTQGWQQATVYVAGAVSALILTSAIQLFKKEVQGKRRKLLLFLLAIPVLMLFNNYFVTIAVLLAGGLLGILLKVQPLSAKKSSNPEVQTEDAEIQQMSRWQGYLNRFFFLVLGLNQLLFFSKFSREITPLNLKVISIFAGISLSLFGGGYVMIPIMESLFVRELHWLTGREFIDAIAFSQATPGPILISAAFIGFKLSGIAGAVLAAVAIFAPSVFLVISVSRFLNRFTENQMLSHALGGIKAVVVSLILVSAYRILPAAGVDWYIGAILLITFILNFRFKVSPVYLILGTILLAVLKQNYYL